jgi:hypothetical protein
MYNCGCSILYPMSTTRDITTIFYRCGNLRRYHLLMQQFSNLSALQTLVVGGWGA